MNKSAELNLSIMKDENTFLRTTNPKRSGNNSSIFSSQKFSILISFGCHILFFGLVLLIARTHEPKIWPAIELIALGNGGTSLDNLPAPNELPSKKLQKTGIAQINPVESFDRKDDVASKALIVEKKTAEATQNLQSSSALADAANPVLGATASQDSLVGSSKGTVGSADGVALRDRERYYSHVETVLQNAKEFPALASRLGHSGEVIVKFTVQRDGSIVNPAIQRASSYSSLNQAALALLKKVHQFEAFPSTIKEDKLEMIIPIRYGL